MQATAVQTWTETDERDEARGSGTIQTEENAPAGARSRPKAKRSAAADKRPCPAQSPAADRKRQSPAQSTAAGGEVTPSSEAPCPAQPVNKPATNFTRTNPSDTPASTPSPADDLAVVDRYWLEHKALLLGPANDVFLNFVQPAFLYDEEPFVDTQTLNMLFTEWLIFDFPFFAGRTPLEQFVEHPEGVGGAQLARLRRIADSQFFSRFEILYKDRETDICALADVRDGHRYDVFDHILCHREQWRDGTIGLRIARTDGPWVPIGCCELYDRAPASETTGDGPGLVHPEDAQLRPDAARASFFLRTLRDLFGIDGRYRHTITTFPIQP